MVGSKERYDVCLEAAGIALAAGDRVDAERALRGAIQAIEGLTDLDAEMSAALIKLAALKQEAAAYTEAEDLYRRALDVSERALGSHDVGLVPALTGIGAARIMLGTPDLAHPFLARALDLSERHLGEGHPDLVILLNDLTRLYLKHSAFEYAEPLLLRLLALKRSKGEDHPEVATVLASLATVRQSMGRYDAAEQLWRRVLEIRERTLAPNHFSLATTLEHLAATCAARGKSREALQLYQRALSIRELTLGGDHGSLRASRERIADLQLQASEDSFDDPPAIQPPLRLSPGDRTGTPPTATIMPERAAPGPPLAGPPKEFSRPEQQAPPSPKEPRHIVEREFRAPAESKESSFAFEPLMPAAMKADEAREPMAAAATSEDPPYLKVLLEIKDELEQTEALERTAEHRGPAPSGITTALRTVFVKHRRAAAIIGIGVVSLPLVAMAMASVARSNPLAARQEEESVVIPTAPLTDSSTLAEATLAAARNADAQKDSIAPAATASSKPSAARVRVSEEAVRRDPPQDSAPPAASWIPTLPRGTVVRLDSVVGAIAPSRASNDAFMVQLASGSDNARPNASEADSNAPLRARLIGALPSPRYPAQLLLTKVGGEVVVRFQVDTAGRPVMNTFSVVSSPDAALTAAVRRVIPSMRFEPARSPGPEFKAITDVMEIGFRFSPDAR